MGIAIIIGIGLTIFLLVYILFKLKTDIDSSGQNHFILQLILLFFVIGLLALLGKATLDSNQECSWVTVNQTVTGNTTVYGNEYQCVESGNNTSFSFYKALMWAVRIIYIYLFIYIAYEVLKYLGWVVPK